MVIEWRHIRAITGIRIDFIPTGFVNAYDRTHAWVLVIKGFVSAYDQIHGLLLSSKGSINAYDRTHGWVLSSIVNAKSDLSFRAQREILWITMIQSLSG